MAQVSAPRPEAEPLSPGQAHELRQYERICQFRDAVLSGTHPRVKLPASPSGLANRSGITTSQPNTTTPSSIPNASRSREARTSRATPSLGGSAGPRPLPANTEFDPIFLEKSDDLIRAELQLQRQRLEKQLKEQLKEQLDRQRGATKPHAQAEAAFDLSEALAKAQLIVQSAAAPPSPRAAGREVPDTSAGSDSDANTFYSSHFDTPQSHQNARVRSEPPEALPVDSSGLRQSPKSREAGGGASRGKDPPTTQNAVPNDAWSHQAPNVSVAQPKGLDDQAKADNQHRHGETFNDLSVQYNSALSLNSERRGEASAPQAWSQSATSLSHPTQVALSQARSTIGVGLAQGSYQPSNALPPQDDHPSPLIRAHELSPVAPQPAHVSSLAMSRDAPLAQFDASPVQPAPAQIAAIRNEHSGAGSSPDSSPRGSKSLEKKKKRRNKRKADRQAAGAAGAASPCIKPEPLSPLPLDAMPVARPSKRPRHYRDVEEVVHVGEPRYQNPAPVSYQQHRTPTVFHDGGSSYPRRDTLEGRRASSVVVGGYPAPQYHREFTEDRRFSGNSHPAYPVSYGPGEFQHARAASQVLVDGPYRDSHQYYRDSYEPGRMSIRPEGTGMPPPPAVRERHSPIMGPPRTAPPPRVVVDSMGREYYEPLPPPPPASRPAGSPVIAIGEPEAIYDRPAPRTAPRHPGPDVYGEDVGSYRQPTPGYQVPRRAVGQPEAAGPDYRQYRAREYSARPVVVQDEYPHTRVVSERMPLNEYAREYVSRSASVRPPEPIRYEVPREYGRVQNPRPEGMFNEYAPPEYHRQSVQPVVREYGPPMGDGRVVRREFGTRPPEGYYHDMPRGHEEISVSERQVHGPPELVYDNLVGRDGYV